MHYICYYGVQLLASVLTKHKYFILGMKQVQFYRYVRNVRLSFSAMFSSPHVNVVQCNPPNPLSYNSTIPCYHICPKIAVWCQARCFSEEGTMWVLIFQPVKCFYLKNLQFGESVQLWFSPEKGNKSIGKCQCMFTRQTDKNLQILNCVWTCNARLKNIDFMMFKHNLIL